MLLILMPRKRFYEANRSKALPRSSGFRSKVARPLRYRAGQADGANERTIILRIYSVAAKLNSTVLYVLQHVAFSTVSVSVSVHCEHTAKKTDWTCCDLPATITEISYVTRLGVLPCWIRAFAQKSESAESTCGFSPNRTRSEFRSPSTT